MDKEIMIKIFTEIVLGRRQDSKQITFYFYLKYILSIKIFLQNFVLMWTSTFRAISPLTSQSSKVYVIIMSA